MPDGSLNPLLKLWSLFDAGIEYAVTSFLLAVGGVFVSADWRERKGFFVASLILGTVMGVTANRTPYLVNFDYLFSMAGAILGPTMLAALQRMSLEQLYELWRAVRAGKKIEGGTDNSPASKSSEKGDDS